MDSVRFNLRGWNYYLAYVSRTGIDEAFYDLVEFELIPKSAVDPFLSANRNAPGAAEPHVREALLDYLDHGVDSAEFAKSKVRALGSSELLYLTTRFKVHSSSAWVAASIFLNFMQGDYAWIAIGEEGRFKGELEPYDALPTDEPMEIAFDFQTIDQQTQALLRDLFRLSPPNQGRTLPNLPQLFANPIKNVGFVYVGAGLCTVLIDTANTVVGLFDFGYGSARNMPQNQFAWFTDNFNYIDHYINAPSPLVVILSHWHRDHVSFRRLAQNAAYFCQNSIWVVPQSTSLAAVNTQNMITAAHFHVMATRATDGVDIENIGPNVNIGKIDVFLTATQQSKNHPHHHGIYADIRLNNAPAAPVKVLLAGDCTYYGMPNACQLNAAEDYVLQASHHGGEYGLSPVTAAQRVPSIPSSAAPTAQHRQLVCSADGVTYGHPDPTILGEYLRVANDRWWHTCLNGTGTLSATMPHNLLCTVNLTNWLLTPGNTYGGVLAIQ